MARKKSESSGPKEPVKGGSKKPKASGAREPAPKKKELTAEEVKREIIKKLESIDPEALKDLRATIEEKKHETGKKEMNVWFAWGQ